MVRVTVWGENVHERQDEPVRTPGGGLEQPGHIGVEDRPDRGVPRPPAQRLQTSGQIGPAAPGREVALRDRGQVRLDLLPVLLVVLCGALALTETLVAKMRILLAPRLLGIAALVALLGIVTWLVEAA